MQPSDIEILVVDDNIDFCNIVAESFSAFGFTVFQAYSGQEALSIYEASPADIVITDYSMPNGDGIFLLKALREKNSLSPKIHFISGTQNISNQDLYDMGADGFFEKPFDFNEVRKTITKSFLDKVELWNAPPIKGTFTIAKSFNDLTSLYNSQEISLGRGGLFFALKGKFPKLNEIVNFEIEIISGEPRRKIVGAGVVQWVRESELNGLKSGIGLEIIQMQPDCTAAFLKMLKDHPSVSYIPKG